MVRYKHCCTLMEDFLNSSTDVGYRTDVDVIYSSVLREYKIGLKKGASLQDILWNGQTVFYCPWCGAKLPISLRGEFGTILRREYNLDPYKGDILPKEFKTDEWWKKRGL